MMGKLQEFNELWKKYVEKEKIRILQKTSPEFVEFIRNITFKDMYLQIDDEDEVDWEIEVKYKDGLYDFRYVYGEEFIDYHDLLKEDDLYEFHELLNEVEITTHIKKLRQEKLEERAEQMDKKHRRLTVEEIKASNDGKHIMYILSNGDTIYVKHDV